MTRLSFLPALAGLLLLWGCGKTEVPPVPVGAMTEYRDPLYGFMIKYPEQWKQLGTAGKALLTESQEVADQFLSPQPGGLEGVQVIVEVMPPDGRTAGQLAAGRRGELEQMGVTVSPELTLSVSTKEAVKVPYSYRTEGARSKIFGYEIFVPGNDNDTNAYRITVQGFGDQFGAHEAVFAAMVGSFEVPVIVEKLPDVWQASVSMSTLNSPFLTLSYPDNMEFVQVKKGDKDYVTEMRADRQDVSIHVDVFGAKELTVDKVWEQNREKRPYNAARKTGETTIDGQKAIWADYSPMRNISSRAYFVVKNDKVIRTTLNWFEPQREVYFPALEAMVRSMKLK